MSILGFLVFGLIVGLIARLLLPGRQPMGLLATMAVGVAGSFLGGVVGNMLAGGHWDRPMTAGWIGSILGALLLVAVMFRGRGRRPLFR
ncbi:MAG: GlsB/YeaQ/YmgE family stress response membrane protein [Polyangiales bacterium]